MWSLLGENEHALTISSTYSPRIATNRMCLRGCHYRQRVGHAKLSSRGACQNPLVLGRPKQVVVDARMQTRVRAAYTGLSTRAMSACQLLKQEPIGDALRRAKVDPCQAGPSGEG